MHNKKRAIRVLLAYAEQDAQTVRSLFDALSHEVPPDSVALGLWELPDDPKDEDGLSHTWRAYDGLILCVSAAFLRALAQSSVGDALLTHCARQQDTHPLVVTVGLDGLDWARRGPEALRGLPHFQATEAGQRLASYAWGALVLRLQASFFERLSTAYTPPSFPLQERQTPSCHCVFAPYDVLLEQLTCIELPAQAQTLSDLAVLQHLVSRTKADYGYFLDLEDSAPSIGCEHPESVRGLILAEVHRSLKSQILDFEASHRPLFLDRVPLLSGRWPVRCLIVPLDAARRQKLVLLGERLCHDINNNYIVFVLQQLCLLTLGKRLQKSFSRLKYDVYDALKRRFGYVSNQVYRQRYDAFRALLKGVHIEFERIVEFQRPAACDAAALEPSTWGWEALARRNGRGQAPDEVFGIAELWGERFRVEADLAIVEKAICAYAKSLKRASNRRFRARQRLCVNVYPCTLNKARFKQLLQRYTQRDGRARGGLKVDGEQLIFEISEKTVVVQQHAQEQDPAGQLAAFADVLTALKRDYQVKFALDDFGVGHSSLSRLFSLEPDVIKVDRAVLTECNENVARAFLEFVTQLPTEQGNPQFEVIVEGVDHDNKIDPARLLYTERDRVNRVSLVQGHLFGRSTHALAPIDRSLYEKICLDMALDEASH